MAKKIQKSKPVLLKGKGKVIRHRPGVAQRVGWGIPLLFHDRGTRRGWVVSSTPRPHFTPGKDPVPILQETGWAPGLGWTCGKSRPHRDSIADRPLRSQSLYRLSYPVHKPLLLFFLIFKWTTCNLTVSHFGTQFQRSRVNKYSRQNAGYLNTETPITADHRPSPRNKVYWTVKGYWNVRCNMLFYAPWNPESVITLKN